jgi:hypothetical protein
MIGTRKEAKLQQLHQNKRIITTRNKPAISFKYPGNYLLMKQWLILLVITSTDGGDEKE